MPRIFTRDEAESLLPILQPLLEELRDTVAELERLNERLATMPESQRRNGHAAEADAALAATEAAAGRARALADAVHAHGAEIKDPRIGLIDFHGLRDGRVVYLCWRLGEARIDYWHELDTGFAGRQPLD